MANGAGVDLTGKVVVLDPETMKAEFRDLRWRLFLADGGFGCSPTTIGRAVIGWFLADGERARVEGPSVVRVATAEDLPACPACGVEATLPCVHDVMCDARVELLGRWS